MGQSLSSRRARPPTPTPTPAAAPAPDSEPAHAHGRSLPRRIVASLPKPSLRSRPMSSLTLPPRPEQTLRGKKRRWKLSRGCNVPAHTEGAVPERMCPLPEHDERHVDRDVDEFGVITHRVPDSHIHSPAPSAKGKEKANDTSDIDRIADDDEPVSSSSTAPPLAQPEPAADGGVDDEQVVISPTAIPSISRQPSPSPPAQDSEHPFLLQPTPSSQQANTTPRPFPPPGTLVVVQGVVHTTDVPRSSDRPVALSNPTPLTTNDALNLNTGAGIEASSTRPSSVPPGTRLRNPLSGILPRPTSMVPTVSSPPPSESAVGSSNAEPQHPQVTSNASGATEENEDEDRTQSHPHGISMAQGPIGGSGLSASSVDVLGTLLSVAAAATAASLLTGSSEPIFSSGLTPSPPPPSSNSIPQHAPSERPLSPTPTSDAGRMRHVWSSLRDRLGLGSGTHNSNHSSDGTFGSGPGQGIPPQPSDVVRPRDPREIMLAEMARAFNLGLGLGGTTTGTPSITTSANSNPPEIAVPEDVDAPSRDRDGEHPLLPPPDSFERFLMDLQSDLRVTLMQEQEPGAVGEPPQDVDETADDAAEDDDASMPELRSISDSDSEDYETRRFDSDDEDEAGCDDVVDDDDDEVRTAQEQLSGRTSPAVSALGSGIHSPFGVRTRPGSISSFSASGISLPHTAPTVPTAVTSGTNGEMAANNPSTDRAKRQDIGAIHPSSSTVSGVGSGAPADQIRRSGIKSGERAEGQREEPVLGVAHSLEASNGGQRGEAEGAGTILGSTAVPPLDAQHSSYVPGAGTGQESSLLGTSSSPGPLTSTTLTGRSASTIQVPSQPSISSLPPGWDPEPSTQTSSTNPTPSDSPMPFRLPFMPSSASRTERTPGGGINWWRMYRFPAIASPNIGQHGSQGSSPLSHTAFRTQTQDPSHTSVPRGHSTDHSQQSEVTAPHEVAGPLGVHTGLTGQARTPSAATSADTPELGVDATQNASLPLSTSTNGEDSNSSPNTSTNLPEHRSNVVVPVIVVGLQSVNADRQPPHLPHPHVNYPPAMDDEDGEAMDFDGLEQPMSVPLHIPEPPEFRHRSTPTNTTQQEQGGQQPARGRTWQSRAANAFRNLRPSRRNADTTSPQPQETPGSRTFLIYVIGGYYPPDHQIITGGNLDSFEALWELAELLGQVKPPTVSKEEIEKSGLEIIQASMLEEYEKEGRVASTCTERCLICLDDYNPDDELRLLTCRHTFHQGCVDRWLETGRNNCPACRTKGVGNENAGPSPSEQAIA